MKPSRKQKVLNKRSTLAKLKRRDIPYTLSPKCSWHYWVDTNEGRYQFWPTVGTWREPNGKMRNNIDDFFEEMAIVSIKPERYKVVPGATTAAQFQQQKIMSHFGM